MYFLGELTAAKEKLKSHLLNPINNIFKLNQKYG
jgi:hypothetical protein